MKLRHLIYLLLLFSPLTGWSQKTWTLRECIEQALNKNPAVKQSDLEADIAGEQLKQAKANIYPNLNGIATNNYNFGQRIDPFTNQFATSRVRSNSFSLNANVDLFRGFQIRNTIQQRDLEQVAARYRSDEIKNDLSLTVANVYLQVLLNQELVRLAEEQLLITRQQLQRSEALAEAGSIPRGDLLNLTAQQAREEVNLVNARNQLTLSFLNLRQLMLLGPEESLSIESPEFDMDQVNSAALSPEFLYLQSLENLPQIKRAEYQLKGSEKAVEVAKGSRSPVLSLGASYGTGYSGLREEVIGTQFAGQVLIGETTTGVPVYANQYASDTRVTPFGDQLENNLNQTVGLSLTIPIFNNFSSRTSINIAEMRREIASYALEQEQIDLRNDIETASADAGASLANYKASEVTVEALEESFRYSQEKYDAGLINILEYNIEKNNLTRARSELLQAKYDYIFKTKILDFFQGKPITL